MGISHEEHEARGWAIVLLIFSIVVGLGYGIFVFFLKAFSPSVGTLSLLVFAVIAGTATFFSPCSFPLMPGFLGRHIALVRQDSRGSRFPVLSNGLSAAAGVLMFDSILGLLIWLVGSTFAGSLAISNATPNIYVRLFRGLVGVTLVVLGALGMSGTGIFHNDSLTSFGRRLIGKGELTPGLEMFAYGFGYVSVGIGCAGPILSGLLLFALAFGGAIEVLLAFLLFAATMAGLMVGVSMLVSVSPSTLKSLTRKGAKIKTAASIVQIGVGLFLVFAAYYNTLFIQLLFPS